MTHPLMLGSKQQRKGHRKPEIWVGADWLDILPVQDDGIGWVG